MPIDMKIVWLVLFVIFVIAEIATAGPLVSIWFCFGSLAAMAAAAAGLSFFGQFVVFVVISVFLLAATKPLVNKYIMSKAERTNADRILEMRGIVTEDIDNLLGKGAIKVDGKEWTARNFDGDEIIKAGCEVSIVEIQGVKVIVQKITKNG